MKGMLSYARLANRLLNTALMIEPGKLQVIMLAISGRLGLRAEQVAVWGEEMAVYDRNQEPDTKPQMIGKVMVIPVHGTMVHRAGWMDAASGLVSYQTVAAHLIEALENPAVESILMDFDSFGGEVSGVFDLAEFVFQARGKKPIWAIANEACYSAAYCIASAADKVVLAETAGVGSVGVYAQHVDFSRANEAAGIVVTPIFAGARKNDGSPDFPLSDEAHEWMQAEVDRKYDLFVNAVAKHRGITPERVRGTEAGLLFGADAVKMKLADAVMTFDEAVVELQGSSNNPLRGPGGLTPKLEGRDMKLFAGMGKEKAEAPADTPADAPATEPVKEPDQEPAPVETKPAEPEAPAAVSAAEVARLALEANSAAMIPALLASPITMEQLTERLDTSKKIRELCSLAKSAKADEFLTAGLTVVQVQEKLIAEMAARTEKADISTKPAPGTVKEELDNSLADASKMVIADADRRRKEFEDNQAKTRRK
jgi:signal peptide peptidase SppA